MTKEKKVQRAILGLVGTKKIFASGPLLAHFCVPNAPFRGFEPRLGHIWGGGPLNGPWRELGVELEGLQADFFTQNSTTNRMVKLPSSNSRIFFDPGSGTSKNFGGAGPGGGGAKKS